MSCAIQLTFTGYADVNTKQFYLLLSCQKYCISNNVEMIFFLLPATSIINYICKGHLLVCSLYTRSVHWNNMQKKKTSLLKHQISCKYMKTIHCVVNITNFSYTLFTYCYCSFQEDLIYTSKTTYIVGKTKTKYYHEKHSLRTK